MTPSYRNHGLSVAAQLGAAVNRGFTDHVSGSLGYRCYSMTFSEDGFDYDARIAGPTLGVTITF